MDEGGDDREHAEGKDGDEGSEEDHEDSEEAGEHVYPEGAWLLAY